MQKEIKYNGGFIRDIVIIVIAVLALNYIGFNVRDQLDSPEVKSFFMGILGNLFNIWENYIKEPALYIWNTFIIGVVWEWIQKIKP